LQEAFQKWRRRWERCLHAGWNCFEGDGGRWALWLVLWYLHRQSGIFFIHLSTLNFSEWKLLLEIRRSRVAKLTMKVNFLHPLKTWIHLMEVRWRYLGYWVM
jgi:hypothetical protein